MQLWQPFFGVKRFQLQNSQKGQIFFWLDFLKSQARQKSQKASEKPSWQPWPESQQGKNQQNIPGEYMHM